MDEKSTIKHIVISGGGTFGLSVYGAICELHKNNFWKLENIESFHGTSVGTIVIIFLLLEYDWETMDKFLIKRPWEKIFNYDIDKCISLFKNCGAFDINIFHKAFDPLFKGKNIDLNTITLKELYDKTGKDFYLYTTELNYFTCDCISHKTHPDWTVLESVYASCALPMIFQPLIKDNKSYADGGIFLNYPISKCIEMEGVEKDEILGIYKDFTDDESDKKISDTSTMMDYFAVFLKNLIKFTNNKQETGCKNQICLNQVPTTMESIIEFVNSSEYRKELIEEGKQYAKKFLESIVI